MNPNDFVYYLTMDDLQCLSSIPPTACDLPRHLWFTSSQLTNLERWRYRRPQTSNLLHKTVKGRRRKKRVKGTTNLWTGVKMTVEMEMK